MNHPDEKLAELRALLCAEGITMQTLRRCSVSGVIMADGEADASTLIQDGWIIIGMDGQQYMLVNIDEGAWQADASAPEKTLIDVEEARL